MILILSTADDKSTIDVIRWLHYLNVPNDNIVRINDSDKLLLERIDINEDGVKIIVRYSNNKTIALHNVTSYWYRRGQWNLSPPETNVVGLKTALFKEIKSLEKFINDFLIHVPYRIGSYHENFLCKLSVLMVAQSIGLKTPPSLITTLKQFLNRNLIASKAISDIVQIVIEDGNYMGLGTVQLNSEQLQNAPKSFFPTLFQQYIDKVFELRIFYLQGKLWPMAIFSQNNEKTKIDFRNYDRERPNRTVPYKLPTLIKNRLLILMKRLKLTSGSIDMAVDYSGDFYFFEVNPIGHFSQVSFPCNYYLEKEIATFLSSSDSTYA